MKKLISVKIPFWTLIVALFFFGSVLLGFFAFARVNVLNYYLSVSPIQGKVNDVLRYGEQPALSNPDVFEQIKADFIEQKTSFIEADLSEMQITYFREGSPEKTVPILTKGREGSWWETPAGIYKIETKEKNHFSSFGHVYQPWSMAFQGNFFIHGWPYYPDGSPVASSYSGGCIRLSDEDAQSIYDLVETGLPVLVFEKDFAKDNFYYKPRIPDISADEYMAADVRNNFVFLEKGSRDSVPVSFIDIFGALVAGEYVNLEKSITVPERLKTIASDEKSLPDEVSLHPGTVVSAFDLLHIMLQTSSHEPLHVFSDLLGSRNFVRLINEKAKSLGMDQTHLNGIKSAEGESYTTLEDLFHLAKYVYNNRRFILDISAGRHTNNAYDRSSFSNRDNRNIFQNEKNFVGGKVVENEDGTYDVFAIFEIKMQDVSRPIAIFLIGSLDPEQEVIAVREYITGAYR